MASLSTFEYYRDDLSKVPPLRAIGETLMNSDKVRLVSPAEMYELARKQYDVTETDMLMYPPAVERLGLPKGAKLLNNCHGKIIGRTAQARKFFTRETDANKERLLKDCREAVSELQERELVKAEVIVGLDPDLMIKATIIGCAKTDAATMFSWLCNFTPFEELKAIYKTSKKLPILDIIVIGDNLWRNEDPFYHNQGQPQLALVDQSCNIIYNFGMRYFGERKKGTLTLAWTSGMKIGMAACHGGIKEFDFSNCAEPEVSKMGKRSIAFFGLSGTGKSSHTNSLDNAGTMPKGTTKVVLHDDAFQIDSVDKCCRVWEPSLFDKTDQRGLDHPEWKYALSVMNTSVIADDSGLKKCVGLEIRNANGRAIYDRDMVGECVNKCGFPQALIWLMKDTCLPPIMKLTDSKLAVAMGAALVTKRNKAENVSEEELKKLAFVPYANPFRVYPLHKDVDAFTDVFANGAECYCFNSGGMWKSSDSAVNDVKLKTSLTLQTAVALSQLEWEDWNLLSGAQIPTKQSIDKLLPGFYDTYNSDNVENKDEYLTTLKERFQQRCDFLDKELTGNDEMLAGLKKSLTIKA